MKQYVAFAPSGTGNSGQKSMEGAQQWAAKMLADKPQLEAITITEVIGEYRRITPTIQFIPVPSGPTIIHAEEEAEDAQAA